LMGNFILGGTRNLIPLRRIFGRIDKRRE